MKAFLVLLSALLASVSAAAIGDGGPVELLWTKDQISVAALDGHADEVKALALSADGSRLVSASSDRTLRLWDLTTRSALLRIRLDAKVTAAALSPDGAILLSGDEQGWARLWDAKTGRALSAVRVAEYPLYRVFFSDDGRRFFALTFNEVFSYDAAAPNAPLSGFALVSPPTDRWGPYASSHCIAVSRDGRLAAGRYDGGISVFDTAAGKEIASWKTKLDGYECGLAFSDDGRTLLSWMKLKATLWDIAAKKEIRTFTTPGASWRQLTTAALSPDGRRLTTQSWEGGLIWDTASGRIVGKDGGFCWTVAFSPDGKKIYLGDYDGSIDAMDPESGNAVSVIPAANIVSIGISTGPTGGYILAGQYHTTITPEAFDAVRAGEKICYAGSERGFALLAPCLTAIRAAHTEPLPAAPVFSQGAYESSTAFAARAAQAESSYAKALDERTTRLKAFRIPETTLPLLFFDVFGVPKITSTVYDPDARIFSVEVSPSSPAAGDFKLRLALRDEIANDKAADFEKRLRNAEPRLTFLLSEGRFSLAAATLNLDKEEFVALPTGADASRTLARVDVGAQVVRPAEPETTPGAAFGYSENPELAAKERELEEQRRRHADSEKLALLEKQLADLKSASAPSYHSDVDDRVAALPEDPDALAVVVGVEAYQLGDLPAARFAERDARAVAARLQALGVAPRNMRILIGADATRAKLAGVLEDWLIRRATAASKIYFYFSGHGAPDAEAGDAYLVPWDGDPSLLKQTGFPLKSLYADLQRAPAARRVAVLDSCFSGAGGRSLLAKGARPLALVRDESGGDVTVLAAAAAGQITATSEAQGHGLFTYHFLKALGAGGRPASLVFADLKPRVEDEAAVQKREQTPTLAGPDAPIP